MHSRLLADIGNTHIHIYDGRSVIHLPHDEAMVQYGGTPLSYISVNTALSAKLAALPMWRDVSHLMQLEGAYGTMGIDRRALCLSRDDGVLVDAGSAITVDVMEGGAYRGGFILEGIAARLHSYTAISPALRTEINYSVDLSRLPATTKDGISYGIIASIKSAIELHADGRQLYFTGGDGRFLSSLFGGSVYSDTLVFEGMQKVLKG